MTWEGSFLAASEVWLSSRDRALRLWPLGMHSSSVNCECAVCCELMGVGRYPVVDSVFIAMVGTAGLYSRSMVSNHLIGW